MRQVAEMIYQRMTADTAASVSLQAILGGSGRIKAGFQNATPKAPCITFQKFTAIPGHMQGGIGRTHEEFYLFSIFSDRYPDLVYRLKALFDGYSFLVPSSKTQVGRVSSQWDWEGPDLFDEALQVGRKDVRYRFFVVPKAINPIADPTIS